MATRWLWLGGPLPDPVLFASSRSPHRPMTQPLFANVISFDGSRPPYFAEGARLARQHRALGVLEEIEEAEAQRPPEPSPPSYDVSTISDAQLKELKG